MRVSGVLLQRVDEILAVGDERANEAEDLADARGHGPIGIGLEGFGLCGGYIEHEHNKNTKRGRSQEFSGAGRWWTAVARRAAAGTACCPVKLSLDEACPRRGI